MSKRDKREVCRNGHDSLKIKMIELPCDHQVCYMCIQEEYTKEGRYQCPDNNCKLVYFTEPKYQQSIIAKSKFNEQAKNQKEEDQPEQQNQQIQALIITPIQEQICLIIDKTDTIAKIKKRLRDSEGINSSFYKFFSGWKQLSDDQSIE